MIFELPKAAGTFSERAQRIREIAAKTNWPQLVAVEQFRVADRVGLRRKLDEVVRGGGEGLMLHLADAPYVTGPQRCADQAQAVARYRSSDPGACPR
jgi:DNA ligase-1